MNCPHCREYLPDTAQSCSYCGGGIALESGDAPSVSGVPSSSRDGRRLWWNLVIGPTAGLVAIVAVFIAYEESLPKELVLYGLLGYLAFWVVSVCAWLFFFMEPRHRTTYVVSIISAVLVAGASGALTLMRDSETRDIRDALLDGEGMSFLDADGNFDRNVYDRLDQVRTLTAQGTGTKELVIDAMEHEEEFSRRFAELGDLTLYVEDYDDPEAVGALIKKLLEYRNIADEYEAATLDFLEGKLGRKLDLDDHAPYSPDEKMAKLRALLSSMREFADVSIEVYTYLLSIQGELELDDNGDLVIESDPVRERFNALIDEQSESAEILSSEAEDFEAYSIEYIKRASP